MQSFFSGNFAVDVKKVFLGFMQALFAEHKTFTWHLDPTLSKIAIIDKNTINLSMIEKRPTIVLSRGNFGWAYTSMGQTKQISFMSEDKQYQDLLSGSCTINCLARNGIFSETLANHVFTNLVGRKDELRAKGIHQIIGLNMGEEQVLKSDSSIELSAVPILVRYTFNGTVKKGYDYYNIYIVDGLGNYYYQGIHFDIEYDLQTITFYVPLPSGLSITAVFTSASSELEVSEILTGNTDGVATTYMTSEIIYGAPLVSAFDTTLSGISTALPGNNWND